MRKNIDISETTLTTEEKEDIGLLILMQQSDRGETVSEEEIMSLLNK